ncbi:MAG: DUF4249 family protein [bacterium]
MSTLLLTACELATVTVPKTAPSVVVHGVLNPSATTQVVLLERTLTGAVTIPDTNFDATDPILSAGGIPITGATADLIDSTGKVVHAIEDRLTLTNGKGSGVYRFNLPGSQLVLGAVYQLRVRTSQGESVTATTRMPRAIVRTTGGLTRTINRDHDTLVVQWTKAGAARSYMVRIESPFGPFFLFTDSSAIRLTGDLRNIFANDIQRLFIPGFRQDITVGAVDSNFYDYYRTNNDPFTGSGIISRIDGGTGVFGSLVALTTGTLTVTADQTDPGEGRFRLLNPPDQITNTFASQFVLYIESKPAREDLPAALSGRYTTSGPNARSDGIVGQRIGSTVTLALVSNQLAWDTVEVFSGQLRGDTLSGGYRKSGGAAVFVRAP